MNVNETFNFLLAKKKAGGGGVAPSIQITLSSMGSVSFESNDFPVTNYKPIKFTITNDIKSKYKYIKLVSDYSFGVVRNARTSSTGTIHVDKDFDFLEGQTAELSNCNYIYVKGTVGAVPGPSGLQTSISCGEVVIELFN